MAAVEANRCVLLPPALDFDAENEMGRVEWIEIVQAVGEPKVF